MPGPQRYRWQSKLRSDVAKLTDHSITNPVLAGIIHYRRTSTIDSLKSQPPSSPYLSYAGLIAASSVDGLAVGSSFAGTPLINRNNGTCWLSATASTSSTAKNVQVRNLARPEHTYFRIRALYDLRHLCSPHGRTHRFYPSMDVHFDREPDPRHLQT
jgi:hypothetical protein